MSERSLAELMAPLTPPAKILSLDSAALWARLLGHAKRWDMILYHALAAARAIGADLAPGQGKASLTAGRAPAAEWAELRAQSLEPHRTLLVDLLRRTMIEDPTDAPVDQPTPYEQDPRRDLAEDHATWVTLLTSAWRLENQGAFWTLHIARICGAKLRPDQQGRLQVVMGQMSWQAWNEVRDDLAPHREMIARLLLQMERGAGASPGQAAGTPGAPAAGEQLTLLDGPRPAAIQENQTEGLGEEVAPPADRPAGW